MKIKLKHHGLLVLVFAFLWTGCDTSVVFEQNQSVPSRGWQQDELLTFTAEITDTLSLHELYLNIRNTTDYPYRNFYLFLDIEFPQGTILRDTIEATLADRAGQWTGSGFGAIKSNRFLFRNDVWFPEPGTYSFTIQQAMRQQVLEGITDIGIRIERK